jgi:hypothetical protein
MKVLKTLRLVLFVKNKSENYSKTFYIFRLLKERHLKSSWTKLFAQKFRQQMGELKQKQILSQ